MTHLDLKINCVLHVTSFVLALFFKQKTEKHLITDYHVGWSKLFPWPYFGTTSVCAVVRLETCHVFIQ